VSFQARVGFALAAALAAAFAFAHPTSIPSAVAKVRTDGVVELRVRFDALAFVLGEKPADVIDADMAALIDLPDDALQNSLADAERRFRENIQALAGKNRLMPESVAFPTVADVRGWLVANGPERLPAMLSAAASFRLPDGSPTFALRFPEALDAGILTTELPYREPFSEPVEPGDFSTALAIPTPREIQIAAESMGGPRPRLPSQEAPKKDAKGPAPRQKPAEKSTNHKPLTTNHNQPQAAQQTPQVLEEAPPATPQHGNTATPPQSTIAQTGSYIQMGFLHIIPRGLDHILFVLGLFLLSARTKDLVKQVTAFTLAHSLTLGLATLGIVRMPASIVEPLIAASIVFIAIENLRSTEMKPWRLAVVCGFGLVHGLGFAGALQDAGLQGSSLVSALLGFNLGVELGQLFVVALAMLALGWFRGLQSYRRIIVVPASVALAGVAAIWTLERIF
jgi:hydrogenase/urease accessory protein HupE